MSLRLSPNPLLQAGGSLILLFFCPPRASDSGEPLLFLYHLPRQLCLLASSGPVPQPHLRCPSASGLADRARQRIPKPPHFLQVLEIMEGWALRSYSSQGPGSPPDRFCSLVLFHLGSLGQRNASPSQWPQPKVWHRPFLSRPISPGHPTCTERCRFSSFPRIASSRASFLFLPKAPSFLRAHRLTALQKCLVTQSVGMKCSVRPSASSVAHATAERFRFFTCM